MRQLILLLVLLGGTAASAGAGAQAEQRVLDIQQFHAEVVVRRDGSIRVTERIRVRFAGSWNGIYRTIPVEYRTSQGLNYTLRLNVRSVTDAAGQPLRHEIERAGDSRRVRIWVPGAEDATRELLLTYDVANALRFFDQHDELYWNVTGNQWEFPITTATAAIVLPQEITGLRTATFTGAHGATEATAVVEEVGNSVQVRAARPLGYHEGLTVVIGWNPGVVHRPGTAEKAATLLASNALLVVPLFAFFGMLLLWRRYGRDPESASFVRYEPPPGMTPAEAGTLIDDSPDIRDITATLVDLAVRGYVEIEETKQEQLFGLLSSRDYELTLLRPEEWPQLKPHERALLQALSVHSHDDRVRLSALHNQFYKHLPEIRKHLNRTLIDGGYYLRRPDHVRGFFLIIGVIAAAALGMLGAALHNALGISPVGSLIAAGLTLVIVAGFGWVMPARTPEGARAHAWVCGFEEFLGRVEGDRLARLADSPRAFEQYLPYAMAFGVEKNWARAFEGLANEPPSWYHGGNGRGFRPQLFVADLGRMTTAAGTAISSAPRTSSSSSGSSGFGGGGFSGGGFGGGGGGGF